MSQLTVVNVKQKLRGYAFADMAASDIYSLCSNFKALKPQNQSPFVHPNGSTENCVSINGTIPVNIRGNVYNIPITIWIRPKHPQMGPLVYVTPTQAMGISQSQYVDTSGKVYLPYLSEWKKGSSDLSTLVQIMCATFVEQCPVYSKAAPPPQQRPNPPYQQRPQPTPPYGQPAGGYGARMPYPQQQPQRYGAGYTPYPTGGSPGMPTPQGTPYRTPYPVSTASTPYPTSTSSYRPQPQPQPPSSTPQAHQSYYSPTSSINPAASVAVAAGVATLSAEEERKKHEETMRIKRQSLETAVEDRIRRQVTQVMNTAQDEMNGLLQTQEDLQEGSKKINAMLQEMDDKTREVDSSIEFLQAKNAELESMLEYLRAQPKEVDVDEAVQATNPLYNQILQLYAEENAIDDTIYYLGEALRKDVIELEVFLKHVRELSRQQFMARATIMKARVHAGLPDHG